MSVIRVTAFALLAVIFLCPAGVVQAGMTSANFGIPTDTMSGGGGDVSSSANYRIKDTVGQTISGTSQGTAFSGEQGYRVRANAILSVGFLDSSDVVVASPSVSFASGTKAGQTANGTLGTASSKIRVTNTRSIAPWSLTIAATAGPSAVWSAGANAMAYNQPGTGSALSINPATGTIASSCTLTGVAKGSSATYDQGVIDSITLLTADGSTPTGCTWDLIGVGLSQTVPASQAAATYGLSMTVTVL